MNRENFRGNEVMLGGGARHPQGGIEFVNARVGLHARIALGDAAVVHQAGCAVVALFCGNAHVG